MKYLALQFGCKGFVSYQDTLYKLKAFDMRVVISSDIGAMG